MNQLGRLLTAVGLRQPNLVFENVGYAVGFWRNRGVTPLAELARLSTRDRDHPDILLDGLGKTPWVGIGPLGKFQVSAPNVHDGTRIRRPDELPDILTVVFGVVCNRSGLVTGSRRLGHPDIPRATVVKNPRHLPTRRRGDELARKRGAHYLLEGKRLLGAGAWPDSRSHKNEPDPDSADLFWHGTSPPEN